MFREFRAILFNKYQLHDESYHGMQKKGGVKLD